MTSTVLSQLVMRVKYQQTVSGFRISEGKLPSELPKETIITDFKTGAIKAAKALGKLDKFLQFVHNDVILSGWENADDESYDDSETTNIETENNDLDEVQMTTSTNPSLKMNAKEDDQIEIKCNISRNKEPDIEKNKERKAGEAEAGHLASESNVDTCIDQSVFTKSAEDTEISNMSELGTHERNDTGSVVEMQKEFLNVNEKILCRIPFAAISLSEIDILNICLQAGVDLNRFRAPFSNNLLMYALSLGSVDVQVLDLLLCEMIFLKAFNYRGETALTVCLTNMEMDSEQKRKMVQMLMKSGSTLSTFGAFHSSAIHAYIRKLINNDTNHPDENWDEIIEELLAGGDDVNTKNYDGMTPLMSVVETLLEEDALPAEYRGKTIKMSILKFLLKKGADPDIQDMNGKSSLMHAVFTQNVELVKFILPYCKEVNTSDLIGMNAIYGICGTVQWAEDDNEIENVLFPILDVLVQAGCDVNAKAIDGSTVLHYVAAKQHNSICEKLCTLGADVQRTDYLRRTPLHLAVRNEDTAVIDILVHFGADLNAGDKNMETPLHHACLLQNAHAVKRLYEAGATIESSSVLNIRPIHLAAENGDEELIEYVAMRANNDVEDIYGAQALHYAAADGNVEAVDYLVQRGCDLKHKASNGQCPLDFALHMGHLKAAQSLAGSDSVRFGNLPPMIFPNRPLVEEEQVDDYFENLAFRLKNDRQNGEAFAKCLLSCKGLGTVNLEGSEAKMISDIIVNFAGKIAERIGQIDPLFQCELLRAGSTFEGVKTGHPDEFDFLCILTALTEHVERFVRGETEGFVKVEVGDLAPDSIKRFCLHSTGNISAAYVLRYFSRLARLATYDVLSNSDFGGHLYAGNMLLPENSGLFSGYIFPLAKLNSQALTFRGEDYKFLDISIDLNPVIFSKTFPGIGLRSSGLLPNMDTKGIYAIPKMCPDFVGYTADSLPLKADLWRVSTQHLEAEVMKSLPQLARDCYMICKIFRMEPMTCSVKYWEIGDLEDDMLPMINHDNPSLSEDDATNTSSSGDENDEGLAYTPKQNVTEDQCNLPSEVESDGEEAALKSCSLGPYTTLNKEEKQGNLGYEEKEMTAEKAIPSYYLKTIFIKEMENMKKSGKEITEKSLVEIPRKVYQELHRAIEEESLATVFMPNHNMMKPSRIDTPHSVALQMRRKYCKNILNIMDSVGFTCD